jgi:hypothetical protein
LRDDRGSSLASEVLSAVAEHRLDPYSAADRLLATIAREEPA